MLITDRATIKANLRHLYIIEKINTGRASSQENAISIQIIRKDG